MSSENNTHNKGNFLVPVVISIMSLLATFLSMTFDVLFSFPSYRGSATGEIICTAQADEPDRDDMKFVFVLDVSASYNYQKNCPSWYNKEKKRINDFISDSNNDFGSDYSETPSLFKLCKLKLSQLLLEYKEEDGEYEVWTVGDQANNRFQGRFAQNSSAIQSVKGTIKAIVNLPENRDLNTDFISLFDRLLSNYSYIHDTPADEFKLPGILLITISDFLHDVKEKENIDLGSPLFKARINDQRSALESRIKLLSQKDIMFGAVVIESPAPKPYEIQVLKSLELTNCLSKSRIEKISIQKRNNELLFPSVKSSKSIRFSYNYGFRALKSTFYIRFPEPGKYLIGLDHDSKNRVHKDKKLNYEIVNITDNPDEEGFSKRGILKPGKDFETFDLTSYERIKLTYNDFLPEDRDFPNLKISFFKGKKKNFLIPIQFEKRPVPFEIWVKIIIMYVLLFLIFSILLYLLYSTARFMKIPTQKLKKISRKRVVALGNIGSDGSKQKLNIEESKMSRHGKGDIICPYSGCSDGTHPQGTKFCPRTGLPLTIPAKKFQKRRLVYVSVFLVAISILLIVIINTGGGKDANPEVLPTAKQEVGPGTPKTTPGPHKKDENRVKISARKEDEESDKKLVQKKESKKEPAPSITNRESYKPSNPGKNKPVTSKKPVNQKKIEVIQVKDLSPAIFSGYKKQLKNMGEVTLDKTTRVEGQIDFCLIIDEEGKIEVARCDNSYLNVNPGSKKKSITALIKKEINRRTLIPEKKENGSYVKITDFRVTIKVIQNKKKLKLESI